MKVVDTIAGAGGFSLGFEQAGCQIAGAIERDEWASETFAFNHPDARVTTRDIELMTDDDMQKAFGSNKVDILLGGPPCQGFSICNKNPGDPKDPRNTLFTQFLRAARLSEPEVLLIENVPPLQRAKTETGERVLEIIEREFRSLGFNVYSSVLEATKYDVPQIRKRLFILGTRKKLKFPFPPPTHAITDDRNTLFAHDVGATPTLWEAISDLPELEARQGSEEMPYSKKAETTYQASLRKGSTSLYNHKAMNHGKRTVERFASMSCGDSISDVPDHLKPFKRNGNGNISGKVYDQNNRRMHPDRPCHTIAASFYANFVHPFQHRNFTAREGARIQSFPDSFRFLGKPTVVSQKLIAREGRDHERHLCQYNQIGNAVPPMQANAIPKHLIEKNLQIVARSWITVQIEGSC